MPKSARAEVLPLMAHASWQRLDSLAPDLPYAWGRCYYQLKSIAEDADNYSQKLPQQLQRLHEVTTVAQKNVVGLLLDLIPAQTNVQQASFILRLLQDWNWRLEPLLQSTAATAASVQLAQEVLSGIGQAVEEMRAISPKRPIMEKASEDLHDLYILVLERVEELHKDLYSVRSIALGLHNQIQQETTTAEKQMPEKWFAYYTSSLITSTRAFSRLGSDFLTLCNDWTTDENYPSSLHFAFIFNMLLVLSVLLASSLLSRVVRNAPHSPAKCSFAQSLCAQFNALDIWHRLTFALCIVIMLNSIVDTLPQFHEGIPFMYVQHLVMAVCMAVWARSLPADPAVWELALPLVVGLLLLHGDAGPLLILLGMGGALLLSLGSGLFQLLRSRGSEQSALRVVWLTAICISLLLVVMGFGRLTVPLLLLAVSLKASAAMLKVVNNSSALLPHTMARAWFVPVFTLFLCALTVSFLVACPGFDTLRDYWYANAVPVFGLSVTFGDAVLTVLSLLGILFVSKISRQILENLGRHSRVLDASAVPVLHVVVDCLLLTIFGAFVMSSLGVDVTSLAFIGGGVSIGVGFAAKTILSNFFCGLVIIFSKMVRAGDVVEIGDVNGRVLSVNMRATVVETLSNGILLVPNQQMLDSRLTNWSLNNLHVRESIIVSVAPHSDMATTLTALEEAAAGVQGVLASPPPEALFEDFGTENIVFVLKVWVKDVRIKSATLSEVRKALRHTLAERGVVLSAFMTRRLNINLCDDDFA